MAVSYLYNTFIHDDSLYSEYISFIYKEIYLFRGCYCKSCTVAFPLDPPMLKSSFPNF